MTTQQTTVKHAATHRGVDAGILFFELEEDE